MVNFNQNKSFVGDLNSLKIYSIMGAGMELTSDKDHAVDKSDFNKIIQLQKHKNCVYYGEFNLKTPWSLIKGYSTCHKTYKFILICPNMNLKLALHIHTICKLKVVDFKENARLVSTLNDLPINIWTVYWENDTRYKTVGKYLFKIW